MNVSKFLPKKQKPKLVPIQGRVEQPLWDAVDEKRKELGLTWNELQLAMCEAFLEVKQRLKG